MTHFNIQVNIQEVTEAIPGRHSNDPGTPTKSIERLRVNVVADDMLSAVNKAMRMLLVEREPLAQQKRADEPATAPSASDGFPYE